MAVVYKTEDLKLGRHVALKFLPDGQALSRFQRDIMQRYVIFIEIGKEAQCHYR